MINMEAEKISDEVYPMTGIEFTSTVGGQGEQLTVQYGQEREQCMKFFERWSEPEQVQGFSHSEHILTPPNKSWIILPKCFLLNTMKKKDALIFVINGDIEDFFSSSRCCMQTFLSVFQEY